MSVSLANIRAELLPGLMVVHGSYNDISSQWARVFAEESAPLVLPAISLPQAIAVGAAAAVIANPVISRRGFWGWLERLKGSDDEA